jgi:hypothetical protein
LFFKISFVAQAIRQALLSQYVQTPTTEPALIEEETKFGPRAESLPVQ